MAHRYYINKHSHNKAYNILSFTGLCIYIRGSVVTLGYSCLSFLVEPLLYPHYINNDSIKVFQNVGKVRLPEENIYYAATRYISSYYHLVSIIKQWFR